MRDLLYEKPFELEDIAPYDINGDGAIDVLDIHALQQQGAGINIIQSYADFIKGDDSALGNMNPEDIAQYQGYPESWSGYFNPTMGKGPFKSTSHLTPDWLMSDIGQLLGRDPVARSEANVFAHGGQGGGGIERYESYKSALEAGRLSPEVEKFFLRTGGAGHIHVTSDGRMFTNWPAAEKHIEENPGLSSKSYEGEHGPGKFITAINSGELETFTGSQGFFAEGAHPMSSQGMLAQTNIFDPESLLSSIADVKRMDVKDLPEAGTFTQFTPGMFKKLKTSYYQPEIEEGRGSLIDKLTERRQQAASAGKGISGYGQRERYSDIAEGLYTQGMEDVYAGIEEQKGQSLQSIYDVLGQWETLLET